MVYPPSVAVVLAPFSLLPVVWATVLFTVVMGAALVVALWVLEIRDWRVYAVVGCWPATISSVQAGNVTALLVLLAAVAWRWRNRRFVPGVAVAVAIAAKLFLWPLVVWLLATRRWA